MKYFSLLFLISIAANLQAQNLINNSSFEQYSSCPTQQGSFIDDEVAKAIGWWSFGNTSDYFNDCATNWFIDVPNNAFGHQDPKTGNAYCGFYTYYASDEHEFVGCKLSQLLIAGQQYYAEFSVCSGKGSYVQPVMYTNNIGARFSMDSFSTNHPVAINNFAHINSISAVMDTVNWVKISGYFTADSNYKYVSFGNFFTNDNTDTVYFAPHQITSTGVSYYFIDDACVALNAEDCPKSYALTYGSVNEKSISVFPNPCDDVLHILLPNEIVRDLSVLNEMNMLTIEQKVNSDDSYVNIDASGLPEGIYMLILHGVKKDFTGRFIVFH